MKKIMIFIGLLFISLILVSCRSKTKYEAAVEFYYSSNSGQSYGNTSKEFITGENIYMQVIIKINSNSKSKDTIGASLTIPNSTDVSSKYFDGQIITPVYDSVNNWTVYPLTIVATEDALEWKFVFQFIANADSNFAITLEFDDEIESIYNKQSTIVFKNIETK